MNFLCELTIVIPRLHCLFSMAKAVSSMVVLVNSETSDSVNSSNFAMCAFASRCLPIEPVPRSDGWPRTWWHTIHILRGLRGSYITQSSQSRHGGACLELFRVIARFQPVFIAEAGCKTKSHWRYVDTHFYDIVEMLSWAFLPSKAAYHQIMG